MSQCSREGLIVQSVDAFSRQYYNVYPVIDSLTVPEEFPAETFDPVPLDRVSYVFFRNDDTQAIVLQTIAAGQKQHQLM